MKDNHNKSIRLDVGLNLEYDDFFWEEPVIRHFDNGYIIEVKEK